MAQRDDVALESQPLLLAPKNGLGDEEAGGAPRGSRGHGASTLAVGHQPASLSPAAWDRRRWAAAIGAYVLMLVCEGVTNVSMYTIGVYTMGANIASEGEVYYDPLAFLAVSDLAITIACVIIADVYKLVPPIPTHLDTRTAHKIYFIPAAAGRLLGVFLGSVATDSGLDSRTSATLVGALTLPLLALFLWLPRVEAPKPVAAVSVSILVASVGSAMAVAGSTPLDLDGESIAIKIFAIGFSMGSMALMAYLVTQGGVHPLQMLKMLVFCEGIMAVVLSSIRSQPVAALAPIFSVPLLFTFYVASAGAGTYLLLWLVREWSGMGFMVVEQGRKGLMVMGVLAGALGAGGVGVGGGDLAVRVLGGVLMLAGCGLYGYARWRSSR